MPTRLRRGALVLLLWLGALPLQADTPDPQKALDRRAFDLRLEEPVRKALLDFAAQGNEPVQTKEAAQRRDALIEGVLKVIAGFVPDKERAAFDGIVSGLEKEPIVLFIQSGSIRRVFVLRRTWDGRWMDPRATDYETRSLGRVHRFWTIGLTDRSAEMSQSVTVETRPSREFAAREKFDPTLQRPIEAVDATSSLSFTATFRRFAPAFSPATLLVTFTSYDRVALHTESYTESFRALSNRRVEWDVNAMWPLLVPSTRTVAGVSDDRAPAFLTLSIAPGGVRDRERRLTSPLEWLFINYPSIAIGVGVPYSSRDESARSYYFGYQFPLRGTPVNLDVGIMTDDRNGRLTQGFSMGLSLAFGRTMDRLVGR